MAATVLISEDQFKQLVPVSSNVTITSPLKPAMLDAQEAFIYPILCKDLYDRVQAELPTPSGPVQALIEALRPALAWYTLYNLLPYSSVKVREMGPVNQTGEWATPASIEAVTWLRGEVRASADRQAGRLELFLRENAADYPEWCGCADCPGGAAKGNGRQSGFGFMVI